MPGGMSRHGGDESTVTTRFVTDLTCEEVAQAVEDLATLRAGLEGSRLVGTVGPRTANARSHAPSVSTYRFYKMGFSDAKVEHVGDRRLEIVHALVDGPTSRIDLEDVLPRAVTRKSLAESPAALIAALDALLADFEEPDDVAAKEVVSAGEDRMAILLRIALDRVGLGRRAGALWMPVAGRPATLSVMDAQGSPAMTLSPQGERTVLRIAGSTCTLARKPGGDRNWVFRRRGRGIGTDEDMAALDGMSMLRIQRDAGAVQIEDLLKAKDSSRRR
jgi:hypothetical protein